MSFLGSLSAGIARIETFVGASLGAITMALILLNVVTRSFAKSLFWVDGAAIASMVWMAFLGASVALHHRETIAVTLLPDAMRGKSAQWLRIVVDTIILIFFAILLALSWTWFDPLTLAKNGFDTKAFAAETFNFIYAEVSTTLGIPKFWLWLIVPIFSLNSSIHALSNLSHSIVETIRPDGSSHNEEAV